MTDTPNTNPTAADVWLGRNVIAVSFEDDHSAYKALTLLGEFDKQRRIGVSEAVVAIRGEDGRVVTKDRLSASVAPAAAGGGLIGLVIGIVGGPLGMLVGGTYGLFAGSLLDLYDAGEAESALGEISRSVKPGHPALLAVVDEPGPEVVDVPMSDLGGTVVRRSVADVEAEIAAAEDAERKAKLEARKELLRARRDRDQTAIETKLEELKAKLHHGKKSETADDGAAPVASER